jgi:hypothetical protein
LNSGGFCSDIAAEAEGNLAEMRSYLVPDKVKYVHLQEHTRLMMAKEIGNSTTLAALEGVLESELPDYVVSLVGQMAMSIRDDPGRAGRS